MSEVDNPIPNTSPITRLTKGYGNQKKDGTHMVDLIDGISGSTVARCVYEPYADQILMAVRRFLDEQKGRAPT